MNSFGSASLQFSLCDATEVGQNRQRFRRPMLKMLDRVNHFYCPSGKWPFRGWVLLPRFEYDQLDKYSTDLQLNIHNTASSDNVGTLKNLAIVHAQCATRGLAADSNALYLIEITDARGILYNQWFQFPLNAKYNIRSVAYPNTFHQDSLNSGTTWTWETMIQDIWEKMGSFLGSWPGLPSLYSASGTPENYWFPGVSAWCALCDVLEHLGLEVACDLTQNNPYTIISKDADDTSFTALQTKYATNLEDDLEPIDIGAGRVPVTVVVLFRRRNEYYGTEETVRYDSFQWSTTPNYSVSIPAPGDFSSASGTHYIWDDFTVRYDIEGVPLAADVATAAIIAQNRVTRYYANVSASEHMDQTYAGALPFTTGSKVDGVCWKYSYDKDMRLGWRTQIVHAREPSLVWPEIWDDYK